MLSLKDDPEYADLLSRTRLGVTTEEDHELLRTRIIPFADDDERTNTVVDFYLGTLTIFGCYDLCKVMD